MRTILSIAKKLSLYGATLLVVSLSPLMVVVSVYADDPAPCVAPPSGQNGVHAPVGADAGTFTYQCDGAYAGLYTNAYYSFDPITTVRTALYSPDYSYDCTSGTWSMTEWDYSPNGHTFFSSRVTPPSSPNLSTGCPVSPANTETPSGASSDTPGGGSSINSTGPSSQNGIDNNLVLNTNNTNNNVLTMSNGIYSQANSGSTFILGNTTGGSAASGDAQSLANVANILQSSANVFGPGTATFVSNINGDVNGDFMFNPSALITNTGPNSQNTANNNLQINTTTANNTNAQINNDINVGATTGDATVANNTSAGDATSGNASAIVNLMNLINSTVAAGHSFVGVVNINGNLNGDILLPPDLITQLLASTGPGSSNAANSNVTSDSTTTNNTTEGITNNVTSTADSGNATVANNTSAGSATTGSSGTIVTLLNLTGSTTIGKDNILVFVNVLGHWIGMIMNAPAGSTAASLGGGITGTGPNSQNTTNNTVTSSSTTTNNTTEGITNNVNVSAQTGNASVTGNTSGGNATSGNANTAVNILNIAGSNINLSDWFGVLFINVFGNWTGSFGVNTSAGDPVVAPTLAAAAGGDGSPAPATPSAAASTFVTFVAHASNNSASNTSSTLGNSSLTASILGSHTSTSSETTAAADKTPTVVNHAHANYWIPAIGVIVALLLLFGDRISILRGKTKA